MIYRLLMILAVSALGATAALAQSSKITVHRGSETHSVAFDSRGKALAPEVGLERVVQGSDRRAIRADTQMQVTGVSSLADNDDAAYMKDAYEVFEVDPPTFRYTLSQAKEQGFLVPYSIYRDLTGETLADWRTAVLRTTFSHWTSKANIIAYTTLPKSRGAPPPDGFATRP